MNSGESTVGWPTRDLLAIRAETTPERTALVDSDTGATWSYRELSDAASEAASGLGAQLSAVSTGRDRRPRIGFLLGPGPGFVTARYAIWRRGWVAVGLHTKLTASELETHAEAAAVDAVVVDCESQPLASNLDCPAIAVGALTPNGRSENRAVEPGPDEVPIEPAEWQPNETALILFTSGTTGEPKGVRLTLGNLVASATASAFRLGVDPSDRWLCCLPVSHMGGLAPTVRTVLYGTTLVVQREFDVAETARTLDEYRITEVSLVPTQLKRLLDSGWTPGSVLETVLLGGAPATDALLDRADSAGVPVYPTYGMTETASQISTATPGQRRAHPGTVGQPLVCTDVTVLDDAQPVDPGEHGELVVDGPTVTPGYLDTAHTDEAFGEYGFHTGDVGYRDECGRLWVVGRRDEVIVTGGELVAPDEVVEALITHEGVDDAAVVGLPDEEWGEQVAAVVVGRDSESPTEAMLREHCRERLASFKLPKTVEFTDEIPRTGSGTVDREAVIELLER